MGQTTIDSEAAGLYMRYIDQYRTSRGPQNRCTTLVFFSTSTVLSAVLYLISVAEM